MTEPDQSLTRNGGSRPVPDPTALTDAAITKAVESLRDYIDGQLGIRDERLTGIDTATTLRLRTMDHLPGTIVTEVSHLELLHDEKFRSVDQRFTERDIRSEREARDNKVAVDAAFAAQKEAAAKQDEANQKAIDKSEIATNEKINKLEQLVSGKTDALSDKIDDLKERVVDVNTTANGTVQQKIGAREDRTGLYLAIGALCSILLVAIAILVFIAAHLP